MVTPLWLGPDDLERLVGEELGVSEWMIVTEEQRQRFDEATGHVHWFVADEPDESVEPVMLSTGSENVVLDRSVIHGQLTLSYAPALMSDVIRAHGFRTFIHYGYDRVRFISPVRIGSRLRLRLKLLAASAVPDGMQVTLESTLETEGATKPSCVAATIYRFYR